MGKPFFFRQNYFEQNLKNQFEMVVQNVKLCNSRALIQPSAEVLIQTDAPIKGWVATCNGISTERMWSAQDMKNHMNVLEL